MARKVIMGTPKRVFDDFFDIDAFEVSHEQVDGTMSAPQRRLVFERGDAASVLLLNLDSRSVVLVRQFKLPTLVGRRRDAESTTDGWITEAVAGMVEPDETPEKAVIRETMEETGYQIGSPRLIARFFSSPGGTSERIFLYFAEVRDDDKREPGGGVDDEDIEVVQRPLDELFAELRKGLLEDPKLIIGAYWLLDYLTSIGNLKPAPQRNAPSQEPTGREPLTLSTTEYALRDHRRLIVGYKTGHIKHVEGVSLWVNSENQDMLMDRFLGKSISANIRRLGANKDRDGNVTEDTIEQALRSAVGQRPRVEIGTVLDTESGALRADNGVVRILHVASVKGLGFGQGVKAERADLTACMERVLEKADQINRRLWNRCRTRYWGRANLDSILFPMLGAGDGGLSVEDVAETIIPAAVGYLQNNPTTTLRRVYFLAYTLRDKNACHEELEELRLKGTLIRRDD